jgi:acetyltransferase-like isoleucine patch superfamily enzyme
MIARLRRIWRRPLSRNLQYIYFRWLRLVCTIFYRLRLKQLGVRAIIMRPLFWTPEFISVGNDVLIWKNCRIEGLETTDAVPHIIFGEGVSLQQNCHLTAAGTLSIGAGTTILYGVMITDIDHCYERIDISVALQEIVVRTTSIGKNCFIGAGAKIFPGTILGDHCVVGANAVVRGHFAAGSVIVGMPGRVVKQYDPQSGSWQRV